MEVEQVLERDRSSLPPEMLNVIAKELKEISDFVRFRAVCPAWRSSTPVTDLPTQFPWILEHYSSCRFYSMSFDKIYNIHTPNYFGDHLCEVTEGYLLTELWDQSQRTTQPFLLNPLNSDSIALPTCHYYPNWFEQRQTQIGKYGFCCEFSRKNSKHELVLYRLGQDNWCELKLDNDYNKYNHFYLKGMLFTLERDTGCTKVTDIAAGTLSYVVPPIEGHLTMSDFHFIETSGDILGVFGCCNDPADWSYEIHHLDVNENGSPCWVKVNNIGNHALFVDIFGAFMLKADDLAGIRANCMYYINCRYVATRGKFLYEMVRMDIETGTKERHFHPESIRDGVSWFVPNLCHLRVQ